jgi:predicted transcriptional regulator
MGKIMATETNQEIVIGLTADIVAAYVSKNAVPAAQLPDLISSVHRSLNALDDATTSVLVEPLTPAVNPKKSVTDDYIICLEDGKKFKSLKRHIGTHYNLTPTEYRARWKLPADYPMVAPAYAAARSALAKASGLGRKKGEVAPAAAKRGRKKPIAA